MTQRDDLEQRDKFGDKLRDAEKAREDQFFAELDKNLVAKLRERRTESAEAGVLNCPGCDHDLIPATLRGVEARQCPNCGGVWLESKAARRLAGAKPRKGLLARLLGGGG